MDTQTLSALSFLDELSEEQLSQLAERCREEHYVPGQHIIDERQNADTWYCILSGWIVVSRDTPTGPVVLGKLGPGRFFGERALLDGGLRIASVSADSACRLAALPRAEFLAMLRETPELGHALRELASSQWRRYAPAVPA